MRIGLTAKGNFRRNDYTSDTNYWVGSMGWGTTDLISVFTWGSGFFDTWSNPANQPAGTSHWTGVQSLHYVNAYNSGYGWQLVGGPISGAWWTSYWNTKRPWYKLAMYSLNEYSSDFWASIMYDSNNSGYYCDPDGTTNLNVLNCISLTETSSIRYKENVVSLDNSLDRVLLLRGVTYNRKGSNDTEIGVIAEEVADIVPEIINFTKSGEADSVSYGRITALLIEAIKEQQQQINELKALLGK